MKKRLKITFMAILALVILLIAGFLIYSSDYYKADAMATQIMENNADILIKDELLILSSSNPSDTALIFYPGAKVEYSAYLPMMEKLSQESITVILIKMPFNFAIFNKNAADKVYDTLPHIKNWFIGGHSMGGAMASSYAADHKDKIMGLILLGAYIYGDVPPPRKCSYYLRQSKLKFRKKYRLYGKPCHYRWWQPRAVWKLRRAKRRSTCYY